MTEWWHDKESEISDLECEDDYYRAVHARKVDGQWEYAIVHWVHGTRSLMCIFRNGKVEKME